MSRRQEHEIENDIHMIRYYADRLTVHKQDGGKFTFDQLQQTDQLADDLGGLSESSSDDDGQGSTGGNAQNP